VELANAQFVGQADAELVRKANAELMEQALVAVWNAPISALTSCGDLLGAQWWDCGR
jgi:hypothetical protein